MNSSAKRKVRKNKVTESGRSTVSHSSTSPSIRSSEGGQEVVKDNFQPFRFLDLPWELRHKIYKMHFHGAPVILDLDPDNYKVIHTKFHLLLTSKQINHEVSQLFYSSHTIRLFPTHPGRFFKTTRPLLARLPSHHRKCITTLQLRLGPGFTNPPRGWVVNDVLGLKDCSNVRVLGIFVEVDTSDPIFNGFRREEDGFYERFSQNLLGKVLVAVPSITEIQFDAYPSVQRNGDMMRGLLEVANDHKKLVSWGPERGWKNQKDDNAADQAMVDDLQAKITSLELSDRSWTPLRFAL